ncbi:MAG: SAP domain-containing protein [Candidatus Poseidoniia archaeon]|nr:SAP domain-containing protein [Candidatus Poseidoniia archaeon]
MAWFGGKKKAKRRPPVLEPVGVPAVQAAPVVQAVPAAVIQAAPVTQPIVEIAPVGVTADNNVMVTTDSVPETGGWAKKSEKPLMDIHKRLDHMMDSKGKSLEDRYKDRFGDKLPKSVTTDSARKEYNENKAKDTDKPNIVFKPRSKLKLTPKNKSKTVIEKKTDTKTKVEVKEDSTGISSKIGDGIKSGSAKTKSAIGSAGAAVGRGAGAVKSGIGRGAGAVKSGIGSGASRIMGLFKKNETEKVSTKKTSKPSKAKKSYSSMKLTELKAELKKKGLKTSGKKADLIARLK